MYKAPPTDRQHMERSLRQYIVYYGLLSGFFIGYVGYNIYVLSRNVHEGRGLLVLGILIGAICVMYAPFIRSTALSLDQWLERVKRLLLGLGITLMVCIVLFVWNHVEIIFKKAGIAILFCEMFSVLGSFAFLDLRLERLS